MDFCFIYYYYYYYYNSSIALNLKQYYSKGFTVHKIQYTCTIKHISRIDTMRYKFQIEKLVQIKKYIYNI
jgi:hypothetical protein